MHWNHHYTKWSVLCKIFVEIESWIYQQNPHDVFIQITIYRGFHMFPQFFPFQPAAFKATLGRSLGASHACRQPCWSNVERWTSWMFFSTLYPTIYRASTIQGGAGFLPSTVWYLHKWYNLNICIYIDMGCRKKTQYIITIYNLI